VRPVVAPVFRPVGRSGGFAPILEGSELGRTLGGGAVWARAALIRSGLEIRMERRTEARFMEKEERGSSEDGGKKKFGREK